MTELLRGYGRGLVALFFAAVALWALILIILPQITMLERAVTPPKRQLDSSIAFQLQRDAQTCISVLETHRDAEAAKPDDGGGGMAVPSMSGMAVPSASVMTNADAAMAPVRPYILQCDRATTRLRMVRSQDAPVAYLNELYDLPSISVIDTDPVAKQIETARDIAALADDLGQRIQAQEARAFPYTTGNFEALLAARAMPQSAQYKVQEDARLSNKLLGLMGLRIERDGQTYERIGLVTLSRTLLYAITATALALLLCYPIAYKVALATPPERAVWLFLGLVVPYAIVELMRVYAWTTIIDNQGVLNGVLQWLGVIADPIQFKRMPGTVFVVVVYTYVLFMVFPIYNVMSTLDRNQIEAAKDLGAGSLRVHARIIIPHAKPGIAVGCIATFMLAAGAFSVPRIISRGLQSEWFSQTIYNKFFESENSNVGAAYSLAYTLVCFLLVGLFMWAMRTRLKDFARVQ